MRLDSIQTITRSAAKNISSAPRPAPVPSWSPAPVLAITLFNYPPSLSDQMTSFAQLRPSHTAISIIIITKVSEDILRTSDQPDTVKLLLRVHPFRFGTAISTYYHDK